MGFTHYWEKDSDVDEKAYAAALKDIAAIVKSQAKILAGGTGEENTKPKTSGGIVFNGIEGDSHETFMLPKTAKEFHRDFCKTAQKPYDIVVVASLARLAEVDGISIGSDGDAEDWTDGVNLASKVLGRRIKNPFQTKPDLHLIKSFATKVAASYKIVALSTKELQAGDIVSYKMGTRHFTVINKDTKGFFYYYLSDDKGNLDKKWRIGVFHSNMFSPEDIKEFKKVGKKSFKIIKVKEFEIVKTGIPYVDNQMMQLGTTFKIFNKYAPKSLKNRFSQMEDQNYHTENSKMIDAFIKWLIKEKDPKAFEAQYKFPKLPF